MTCTACGEQPKNTAKDFTKAVIEIDNPETLVLFRKVVIPASMGDETAVPASIGKYRNVLLVYEANNHAYLYSSDGIPTLLTSDVAQELEDKIDAVVDDLQTETSNRQTADEQLGNDINAVAGDLSTEVTNRTNADTALGNRLTTVEGVAATAVQPADINKVVTTDIATDPNASTSTVQINESKVNLADGTTSTDSLTLPVASTTQAGVMNSSTYDAITSNTNNINAMMNGAVAITGLAATPTQADLTTAWLAETGLSALINRASIYDVDNNKVWTYYTNDTTWHAASNTSQVTINTFTNNSEGTIKGSTNTGQIFAENDGTGSVNGWDALNNTVAGKQDTLTAGSNITINSNTISATDTTYSAGTGLSLTGTTFAVDTTTIAQKSDIPTVNDATLTIQQNGASVATFTANSSTNTTANITSPVITMQTTDPGEGSALAENNYIGVYGGDPIILDYSLTEVNTGTKWIDGSTIYKKTVNYGTLPNATTKNVAHNISNINRIIEIKGYTYRSTDGNTFPIPFANDVAAQAIGITVNPTDIVIKTGTDRTNCTETYITLYYTKSS